MFTNPDQHKGKFFVAMSTLAATASLVATAHTASADVITLIDYSPATLNGGFETVGAGDTASGWTTGFGVTSTPKVSTNLAYTPAEGSKVLAISSGGGRGAVQNTGYEVNVGDTFSLEFDWDSGYLWKPGNQIDWQLLTTIDNTTAGAVTSIASGTVSGKTDDGTAPGWSTAEVLTDGGTVSIDNVGQELWVVFLVPSNGGGTEYGFIDKVRLSVDTVVPEPGSLALLGLGVLCVLRRRRG